MENMDCFGNTTPAVDCLTKDERARVNLCKRLRTLGAIGRVHLDLTEHRANRGRNTHLFDFIEACGFTHYN